MTELGARLREARKALRLKQYEMAKKLGLGQQQFSHYETGRISSPGTAFIEKLFNVFNISPTWMLTGSGPMFMEDIPEPRPVLETVAEKPAEYNSPEPADSGFLQIPLLTEAGAATGGYTDLNIDNAEHFAFRVDFIRRIAGGISPATTKHLFMVRIKGDSMTPTLLDNEIVLVNSHPNRFKNGGIYLVRDLLDQSTLAKRIYKINNSLILHSDNLNYKDKTISLNDAITMETIIIGRIVWGGRYYI